MASSTFLFHPSMNEVVPYNAVYEFPSQATRSTKRTIKMQPRNNAQSYVSGSVIRFEFPASGYLNTNNTYLAFNCRAKPSAFTQGTTIKGGFEFQNNIASIFRRVRVLYGSLVLEDIQDYNILQRLFTETLSTAGTSSSSTGIFQGIGYNSRKNGNTTFATALDRYNYHSITELNNTSPENTATTQGQTVRRYAIPINTGVFQQKRLIPLKFMSSNLQIEFELAEAVDCQIWTVGTVGTPTIPATSVTEVGLPEIIAELLEFDADFDVSVFESLKSGLAIPYQSWHVTAQNIGPTVNAQLNIQESARSVRYALAVLTDDATRLLNQDAHFFWPGFFSQPLAQSEAIPLVGATPLTRCDTLIESFQWRLGGTYYPSQPVACYGGSSALASITLPLPGIDSNYADPPVEAYCELMKVFDNQFGKRGVLSGDVSQSLFSSKRDLVTTSSIESGAFVMACDFLTDRGDTIGGINAEEQNDLMLIMKFASNASAGTAKVVRTIICFDNIMILGESNNMVLVN